MRPSRAAARGARWPSRPFWPFWLPPASLRLRLTLWYTAVLAATVLVFGLALYLLLVRTLSAEAYQVTVGAAEELARTVQVRAVPRAGPLQVALPPSNVFGAPDTFVQVADVRTGRIVARSATLGAQTLPFLAQAVAAARRDRPTVHTLGTIDRLHIYSTPLLSRGQVVGVVQVGRSLAPDDHLLDRLRLLLALGGALVLPTAAGLGWVLAGRALAPIADFARTAEEIGRARDFARRIAHRGPRDEVGHLASTVNAMLAELEGAHHEVEAAHHDLAAANARLAEALAVQQRFEADASHELRTPLTIIRANADVLHWMDAGDAPERTAALADLAGEAERMGGLVNDLLTLARADAGQHFAPRPTPLRPLVEEACRQARLLACGQEVVLGRADAADAADADAADEVTAAIDPDAVKQLLLILLDNALKYTPAGGHVTLALAQGNAEACVTVSDTGMGIDPADLPRIFERFYRADAARAVGGSGLGLAIAQWIARQHGGRIEVASTPGRGSAFTVCLPARQPD